MTIGWQFNTIFKSEAMRAPRSPLDRADANFWLIDRTAFPSQQQLGTLRSRSFPTSSRAGRGHDDDDDDVVRRAGSRSSSRSGGAYGDDDSGSGGSSEEDDSNDIMITSPHARRRGADDARAREQQRGRARSSSSPTELVEQMQTSWQMTRLKRGHDVANAVARASDDACVCSSGACALC